MQVDLSLDLSIKEIPGGIVFPIRPHQRHELLKTGALFQGHHCQCVLNGQTCTHDFIFFQNTNDKWNFG